MTQPAAFINARTPAPPAARPQRSEAPPETPRRQSEARAAQDRFAAKLERDSDAGPSRSSGTEDREQVDGRGSRREAEQDRTGAEGQEGSGGQRGGEFLAPSVLISAVDALRAIAPTGGATPLTIEPAMLERMAAQIAESWPGGGVEAATVTFPDTAIASSAQILRSADGSFSVTIAGLDPRITASQNARLQLELTNALARRRIRIRSLRFEAGASQSGRDFDAGVPLPGATSAIPRVV